MRWRLGLWLGLILGWLVMLLYLWAGFATFPSPDRLEQSRMMAIPSLRTVAMLGLRSAAELAAVLVLLLPWWGRFWALRLLGASLALSAWFIATTPLTVSAVHWVHRRWIAGMAFVLLLSCCVVVAARLARLAQRSADGGAGVGPGPG